MVSAKTLSSKRATLLRSKEKKRKEEEQEVSMLTRVTPKKKRAEAEAPKSAAGSSADGGKKNGRKSKANKAKAAATSKEKEAKRKAAPKAKASSTKKKQKTTKVSDQSKPESKEIEALSGKFLEGKYLLSNLKVRPDNVCPVIRDMFKGILGRCEGSSCDGNPHSYDSPTSNLLAFDMYWKRSAVGVKVLCDLIRTDDDVKKVPSKSAFKCIGYFKNPTCCIGLHFAAAKIFAPHPNLGRQKVEIHDLLNNIHSHIKI